LLLSISWQCAAKSAIFINFKLNQEELAKTVCINKNKPKSCCAAKCHLDKEIKKEDKRQSDLPSNIKDKVEKSELRSGLISFLFIQNSFIQTIIFPYNKNFSEKYTCSVFHPPCIA
jgi:hypothetical protein